MDDFLGRTALSAFPGKPADAVGDCDRGGDGAKQSGPARKQPAPDAAASRPPLSLANPLPNAGRNSGYPYGSDGSGRYLLHNGLDMADENRDLAVAPADGEVIVARDDIDEMFGWRCDWYGQLVVLRLDETQDGQPVYVLFGHVQDVQVTEGQRVARGEPVARQGTAGVATVAHLHLEVRVGANTFGATRNPLLWLEPWSGSGVVAGRLVDPNGHAWEGVTVTLIDNATTFSVRDSVPVGAASRRFLRLRVTAAP